MIHSKFFGHFLLFSLWLVMPKPFCISHPTYDQTMKIEGTFLEVDLVLNQAVIELQITKRKVVQYNSAILEFSEVEFDLAAFLEESQLFLPKIRLQTVLQALEVKYLELSQHLKATNPSMKKISDVAPVGAKIQKILLTGGSGKSSIYHIIFEGMLPYETTALPPTPLLEKHQFSLPALGSNKQNQITIWETGAEMPTQDVFAGTAVLIFVINAFDVGNYEKSRQQLHRSIMLQKKHGSRPPHLRSSQNNIFCLLHKMDLFPKSNEQFKSLVKYFQENPDTGEIIKDVTFFPTTIFDSSIYQSWSKIIESLMPKSSKLNEFSNQLKNDLGLYAALIVERRTGLPICSSKTLLDDSALVGNTNRLLITVEKVLPEFELAKFQEMRVKTSSGCLEIIVFDLYFILVLLYPDTVDLSTPKERNRINEYIEAMRTSI